MKAFVNIVFPGVGGMAWLNRLAELCDIICIMLSSKTGWGRFCGEQYP